MTVPDEAVTAGYAARYGEPVDTYTWDRVADKVLEAAAPLIGEQYAAAERDRWRPMVKQIYDAAIEGGKSPAEVRHRIINILDDAGAFGGGPFADLLDGAP